MIRLIFTIYAVVLMLQIARAEDTGYLIWDRSGSTWYDKWDNFLDQSDEFTDHQKIVYYSRVLGVGKNRQMTEKQNEIYSRAQKLLVSIPGHAEFYDARIRSHLKSYREAKERNPSKMSGIKFANDTFFDFPILRHLPSPETVKVLGELLMESEVFEMDQHDTTSLAAMALQQLHHLPLASKPVQSEHVFEDQDLETYQLWYSQIKAGNRTFRFEGDPNEYTLAGPVRTLPDLTATHPKARDPVNSPPSAETEPDSSTQWLALTLGGTLIGGAIWYWFVSRRKA